MLLLATDLRKMSAVKVKPITPIPKRMHGFSIDSIMRRDEPERSSSSSEDDSDHGEEPHGRSPPTNNLHQFPVGRIPPLHPSLPAHVQQLLLHEAGGRPTPELLAMQSQAWAFGHQQLGAFPGLNGAAFGGFPSHLGTRGPFQHGVPTHHSLLAAAAVTGRDPLSVYPPWMLNKQGPGLMGYPFGELLY